MSFRYTLKCDLCGKEHEIGWARSLDNTQSVINCFMMPERWGTLNWEDGGVKIHMCPICAKALGNRETIVSAYLSNNLTTGEPIVVPKDYLVPKVIPLADKKEDD